MSDGRLTLAFEPLLPEPVLWALGLAALAVAGLYAIRRGRAPLSRGLALLALCLALAGPTLVREERRPLPDVVALLVDRSESMKLSGRAAGAEAAAKALQARLSAIPGLDVRLGSLSNGADGTRLSPALDQVLADTPVERVAAAIVVSDGRFADGEEAARAFPLHQALVGAAGERDRRLSLLAAPRTGSVGSVASLSVQVDDPAANGQSVPVIVRAGEEPPREVLARAGEPFTIDIALDRRGPLPVGLEVAAAPGEISTANNVVALSVMAVRDRLRVMLVTGEPYAGARAWRNLLKADASVDLVQFTILRPPDKQDFTPIEELSLIPFPVRELFLEKIDGFDLVVFDRFKRLVVLPDEYLESVAQWVERGGAFLMLAGPAESLSDGVFSTPLARVIPARPTGRSINEAFKPALTPRGRAHPISAPLADQEAGWGRWLAVQASEARGDVLLEGAGQPLVVVSPTGRGRAAAVMSDQAWLWQRGHEGGGPFNDLFRRTAHWLMKDPDLDADRLTLKGGADSLTIERRAGEDPGPALVEPPGNAPAGQAMLEQTRPGVWTGAAPAPASGLYRVRSGDRSAFAVAGVGSPAEARLLTADGETLRAANRKAGGGGVAFLGRDGGGALPAFRRVSGFQAGAGEGWWALRRADAYTVAASQRTPLLPPWALGLALLALTLFGWAREGRQGR